MSFLNFIISTRLWNYAVLWDFLYRGHRYGHRLNNWGIHSFIGRFYLACMLSVVVLIGFNLAIKWVTDQSRKGDFPLEVLKLMIKTVSLCMSVYLVLSLPIALFAYNHLRRAGTQLTFYLSIGIYLLVGSVFLYVKMKRKPVIRAGYE